MSAPTGGQSAVEQHPKGAAYLGRAWSRIRISRAAGPPQIPGAVGTRAASQSVEAESARAPLR